MSTRVDVYDDGYLRAWIPALSAQVSSTDWLVSGSYGVDSVSGATRTLAPDGLSGATQFSDQRQAGSLRVSSLSPDRVLTAGWAGSIESDYTGQALSLSSQRPILDSSGAITLGFSAGWGLNRAEGADSRDLSLIADADWSQIVSPRTVVGLSLNGQQWACGDALGCHASPYRYMMLYDPQEPTVALRERHPDTRTRGALGLRSSHSLGPTLALHTRGRGYADSWGILGGTLALTPAVALADDRLLLRATLRGSAQTGALFYTPKPVVKDAQVPAWRTADRELEPGWNLSQSVDTRWTWYDAGRLGTLSLELRAQHTGFHYADSTDRHGWLIGGGLHAAR